tara:strand:- start:3988 stop:4284 length:297 start_codon:yes stop_codon:yes gene_type:complete
MAWPLAPPPNDFGEWSLLSIREVLDGGEVSHQVDFVVALSPDDVDFVEARLKHRFGVTLSGHPWALVKGVVDYQANPRVRSRPLGSFRPVDPLSRTGV